MSTPQPERAPWSRFGSWALLLVVGMLTSTVLGCGSSRGEYVFTGNTPIGPGTAGSLTFLFEVPNTQTVVPADTTEIRFAFFSGADATGSRTIANDIVRPLAPSITIENVPVSTRSVRATAYNADGFPTRLWEANLTVAPGQNTVVDLFGGGVAIIPTTIVITPANGTFTEGSTQPFSAAVSFDNGDTVSRSSANGLVWTSSDNEIFSIGAANGIGEAIASGGPITITASYGGALGETSVTVEAVPSEFESLRIEAVTVVESGDPAVIENPIFIADEQFRVRVYGVSPGGEETEITANPEIGFSYDDDAAQEAVLIFDPPIGGATVYTANALTYSDKAPHFS